MTLKLFARATRDAAGARLGRRPLMMAMLGRPGEVAVFTGEEDFESPRAKLRRYPGGHFSAYSGQVFERMVADEVAFLSEHLQAGSSAAS